MCRGVVIAVIAVLACCGCATAPKGWKVANGINVLAASSTVKDYLTVQSRVSTAMSAASIVGWCVYAETATSLVSKNERLILACNEAKVILAAYSVSLGDVRAVLKRPDLSDAETLLALVKAGERAPP